jgi:hypothetical protein
MTMAQTKAMPIQAHSCPAIGCFHHNRSDGGRIALIDFSLID